MARPAEAPVLRDAELEAFCARVRAAGRSLVLTNGCFDVLHLGHAAFLRAAAGHGDVLIVGVNDDASVHDLKGAERPTLPLEDRLALVTAIRWVDAAVAFGERTADGLIERIRPSVYVKGADYDPTRGGRRLPELATLERLQIATRFVPLVQGRSSSSVLDRARGRR